MFLGKKVKKMDEWDVGLIKLSVAAFILFVITIWPAALSLTLSISPWWYLIVFVLAAARPFYRIYIKK